MPYWAGRQGKSSLKMKKLLLLLVCATLLTSCDWLFGSNEKQEETKQQPIQRTESLNTYQQANNNTRQTRTSDKLTLSDFVNASTKEILYDEDFTPIVKLNFKNISQKTITTIEITATYEGYDDFNYGQPICTRTISTNIAPNEVKTLTVRLDKDKYNNKPKTVGLARIRFSDGSIIDK